MVSSTTCRPLDAAQGRIEASAPRKLLQPLNHSHNRSTTSLLASAGSSWLSFACRHFSALKWLPTGVWLPSRLIDRMVIFRAPFYLITLKVNLASVYILEQGTLPACFTWRLCHDCLIFWVICISCWKLLHVWYVYTFFYHQSSRFVVSDAKIEAGFFPEAPYWMCECCFVCPTVVTLLTVLTLMQLDTLWLCVIH